VRPGWSVYLQAIRLKPISTMKKDIHPEYDFIDVKLSDGSVVQMRSTMKADVYNSEIDSTNHPFYTGKRQFVDTAGRVEKFKRRYAKKTAE